MDNMSLKQVLYLEFRSKNIKIYKEKKNFKNKRTFMAVKKQLKISELSYFTGCGSRISQLIIHI